MWDLAEESRAICVGESRREQLRDATGLKLVRRDWKAVPEIGEAVHFELVLPSQNAVGDSLVGTQRGGMNRIQAFEQRLGEFRIALRLRVRHIRQMLRRKAELDLQRNALVKLPLPVVIGNLLQPCRVARLRRRARCEEEKAGGKPSHDSTAADFRRGATASGRG